MILKPLENVKYSIEYYPVCKKNVLIALDNKLVEVKLG